MLKRVSLYCIRKSGILSHGTSWVSKTVDIFVMNLCEMVPVEDVKNYARRSMPWNRQVSERLGETSEVFEQNGKLI